MSVHRHCRFNLVTTHSEGPDSDKEDQVCSWGRSCLTRGLQVFCWESAGFWLNCPLHSRCWQSTSCYEQVTILHLFPDSDRKISAVQQQSLAAFCLPGAKRRTSSALLIPPSLWTTHCPAGCQSCGIAEGFPCETTCIEQVLVNNYGYRRAINSWWWVRAFKRTLVSSFPSVWGGWHLQLWVSSSWGQHHSSCTHTFFTLKLICLPEQRLWGRHHFSFQLAAV